jgi:hypothetical protein
MLETVDVGSHIVRSLGEHAVIGLKTIARLPVEQSSSPAAVTDR